MALNFPGSGCKLFGINMPVLAMVKSHLVCSPINFNPIDCHFKCPNKMVRHYVDVAPRGRNLPGSRLLSGDAFNPRRYGTI